MNTYREQLKADVEREDVVFAETLRTQDADMAYAGKAGGMAALANYYASSADHEAAQRQRISSDPKALIAAFTGKGPSAEDIAILLNELQEYLRSRPEMCDVAGYVEEAAACARYEAKEETDRAEEAAEEALQAADSQRAYLIERGIITC